MEHSFLLKLKVVTDHFGTQTQTIRSSKKVQGSDKVCLFPIYNGKAAEKHGSYAQPRLP